MSHIIKIEIEHCKFGSGCRAYIWGKGAPILRMADDRPSSSAWWPTEEAAVAELPAMLGHPVAVVRRDGKPVLP